MTEDSKADETASSIFDNAIAVHVSPTEYRFVVHQNKICEKFKFFRAACSKRWIEGQEKLVRLPEVDIEVFQEYWEWVYSGTIPAGRCTVDSNMTAKNAEHLLLINLYLLADLLDDIKLRNWSTEEMSKSLETCNMVPLSDALEAVWSGTQKGSRFRRQFVDFAVARVDRDSMAGVIEQFPSEFVREFAIAAMRKAPLQLWQEVRGDGSQYLEPEESKVNNS